MSLPGSAGAPAATSNAASPGTQIAPFSGRAAGAALPPGWTPWIFGGNKNPTLYSLASDPQLHVTVLDAIAVASASGLVFPVNADPKAHHFLQWDWKVGSIIQTADVSKSETEDSPVRIILGFAGDSSKLSFRDQLFFQQVKLMTGQEMPYATLMYVWDNHAPVGSIVANPHTGRIQMVVAEHGAQRVGRWIDYQRDFAADFRRAYGEDPGQLIMVGILSDTDNTGESIEASYGDIRLTGGVH